MPNSGLERPRRSSAGAVLQAQRAKKSPLDVRHSGGESSSMHFTTADIDLERFQLLAIALISPHVTEVGGISRWRSHNSNRLLIEIPVKTFRAAGWSPDDCEGTGEPSALAFQAVHNLARDLGLSVKWESYEKGWGSFFFW